MKLCLSTRCWKAEFFQFFYFITVFNLTVLWVNRTNWIKCFWSYAPKSSSTSAEVRVMTATSCPSPAKNVQLFWFLSDFLLYIRLQTFFSILYQTLKQLFRIRTGWKSRRIRTGCVLHDNNALNSRINSRTVAVSPGSDSGLGVFPLGPHHYCSTHPAIVAQDDKQPADSVKDLNRIACPPPVSQD